MGFITTIFGKNKSSKNAQKYLDTLSSPTSNTPSSRFSTLTSYLTGKRTRYHNRKRRGVETRRKRRRRY